MQSIHSSKLWKMNWIPHQMIEWKKTWKNAHVYKQHMKHIFFCLSLIIVIGLVYSMYTVNRYYAQLLTVIFMLILMVSPSLNPKSSSCFGAAFSWSIFSWFFTHLKWSWSATFKSNESDRSPKPRPKNAVRPATKKQTWHVGIVLKMSYIDQFHSTLFKWYVRWIHDTVKSDLRTDKTIIHSTEFTLKQFIWFYLLIHSYQFHFF